MTGAYSKEKNIPAFIGWPGESLGERKTSVCVLATIIRVHIVSEYEEDLGTDSLFGKWSQEVIISQETVNQGGGKKGTAVGKQQLHWRHLRIVPTKDQDLGICSSIIIPSWLKIALKLPSCWHFASVLLSDVQDKAKKAVDLRNKAPGPWYKKLQQLRIVAGSSAWPMGKKATTVFAARWRSISQ